MRTLCQKGVAQSLGFASDPTKPATFDDIAQAFGNVRELTRISEREIHKGEGSFWRRDVPITLYAADGFPADWWTEWM